VSFHGFLLVAECWHFYSVIRPCDAYST